MLCYSDNTISYKKLCKTERERERWEKEIEKWKETCILPIFNVKFKLNTCLFKFYLINVKGFSIHSKAKGYISTSWSLNCVTFINIYQTNKNPAKPIYRGHMCMVSFISMKKIFLLFKYISET